jgi:phosphosulfolactate synthase
MLASLVEAIGLDNIIFEAPEKGQQTELILKLGNTVNLGNIRPDDVIPLETLRRGLRGDTLGKV